MGRKKTKNTNEELKNNLLQAVERATQPTECLYIVDGKPCCVIAQLAVLEGINVDTIAKWDTAHKDNTGEEVSEAIETLLDNKTRGIGPLQKYPKALLKRVQLIWDTSHLEDIKAIRNEARREIHEYFEGSN